MEAGIAYLSVVPVQQNAVSERAISWLAGRFCMPYIVYLMRQQGAPRAGQLSPGAAFFVGRGTANAGAYQRGTTMGTTTPVTT
jgi:hypothetical protein